MTENKICPKTLMIEIYNDDPIATGAPCIEDRCMAWIPERELQETFGFLVTGKQIVPGYCKLIGVQP